MMKNFAEIPSNKSEKDKWGNPFWKKVESREDFTCDCGEEIKKGEMINIALTQEDAKKELEPQRFCDDCFDNKLIEESEEKDRKKGFNPDVESRFN